MSAHISTVRISPEEYDRINRLLNIDSLEDMSDDELIAQGANTNHCEGVFARPSMMEVPSILICVLAAATIGMM